MVHVLSILALLALVEAPALAQEAPPVDGAVGDPAPSVTGRTDWRASLAWTPVGPRGVDDLVGVAISPDDARFAALVDAGGAVWVTEDGTVGWRASLRPMTSRLGLGSDDEADLLNAETRLRELLSGLDLDEPGIVEDEDDLEDALDDVDGAVQTAQDALTQELQADALQGAWFQEVRTADGELGVSTPRVWLPGGGRILVGRPDGLFLSDDRGQSFRQVRGRGTTALARLPTGRWIAGGLEGGAWSDDLERWNPIVTPLAVRDLAAVGFEVVAATDDGLFISSEGEAWSRLGADRRRFRVVAGDPLAADALWVGTVDNLFRTEDMGETFEAPVGPPLVDPRALAVDPGGVVLAAADDGAWVSRDAGRSWSRLEGGLAAQDARGVAVQGDLVLLATEDGLFRLVQDQGSRREVAVDDAFPPVGVLLSAAARRVGADLTGDRLGAGGQFLTWLLPRIDLEVRHVRSDARMSALDAGYTTRADGDLQWWAGFTWTPPGRNLSLGDPQEVVVQSSASGPRVYAGVFDQWMLLGNVGRRITDVRLRTGQEISDLYYNRALLLRERGRVGTSLIDQVHVELRIAETEAWLDALTDGAVTAWRTARTLDGGT